MRACFAMLRSVTAMNKSEPSKRSLREIPEVDFASVRRLPRGKYAAQARRSLAVAGGLLDHVLTKRQLEERADAAAQRMLGVRDRHEAFARLDRGELAGTVAEAEFSMLRVLLRAGRARG